MEKLKLTPDSYRIPPDPEVDAMWAEARRLAAPLRTYALIHNAPASVFPGPLPGRFPDKDGRYLVGLIDPLTGQEWQPGA